MRFNMKGFNSVKERNIALMKWIKKASVSEMEYLINNYSVSYIPALKLIHFRLSEAKRMKEQIKGFNEAYKIVKKKGFQNYFCLGNTTWKDAKNNFDKGVTLQEEVAIMILKQNVNVVLALKNGETIPVCKECKRIMDPQEFRAGFEKCEHCDGVCGCNAVLGEEKK